MVPIQELNRQREYMRLVREMDVRPQKYHIVTLGCQMNERDSETIAGMLAEMGMELKDLPKYPLLLLEDLSNSRRYIDRYAEENGVVLNPILELGSSDLLVSFAEINLGLTYVIEEFTQRELQNKHLFEIPVEPPVPKRSIGMVRLKNVAMPHALKGFIDLIEFPKEKN